MIENVQVPIDPLAHPKPGKDTGYQPFNPRVELLPKGWNGFNSRALPCDILVEHDVCFTVRDGTKLYADVYRPPEKHAKVPAILCWSPFGKKFNGSSP